MRRSTKIERAATQAVARRFSATLHEGRGSVDAYLTVAGTRIALLAILVGSPAGRRAQPTKPRLRFDRVALGLVDRLRTALEGTVPEGRTVIVTIAAPIRLASRTTIVLEEKIRKLLATRAAPARLRDTIHGNEIEVHFLKGGTARTAKLIGFVHNPDSDPTLLIDVARSLLARLRPGERATGSRWLVITSKDDPVPIEASRHVCSQLGVSDVFQRTLVVTPAGQVATLRCHRR